MIHIDRPQNVRRGIVLMMTGIALFTVGEAIVKALASDYEIAQIVWARYVFHTMVTLALFSRLGLGRLVRSTRPWLHVARSALMLVATMLFFTALRYLPLADAVSISFIAPLLVTALSIPILREQVGIRRWIAIFIGFGGVMIIIRPGLGVVHWAAFLPLGTAVCYAFYQILTRIAARTDDTQTSLFWTSAFGAIVSTLFVPFFWTMPAVIDWGLMVALGVIYGFGHYLVIRGLEVAPASMLSPFMYTQIIWATVFGLLIWGQFPDAATLAGAAIVIGSGLYVWWRETRRVL